MISATDNNLNCVICADQIIVAAGDRGTVLLSSDGRIFTRIESGSDKNINGITFKDGILIAGADKGTILVSKNGKTWSSMHLEVRGNILSVTANESYFFGITDYGEIIKSTDGFIWEITDYNKVYSGYNKSCIFRKVLLTENRIVIIGSHTDGSPAVLFSSLGNVWTERAMVYNDEHGEIRILNNKLNDITYDQARDQFFLACDKGEIFCLPSCSKCNISETVSGENINSIICTDDYLVSVGEGFFVNILKL